MHFPLTQRVPIIRIALSVGVSLCILAAMFYLVSTGQSAQQRPGILRMLQDTATIGILTYFILQIIGIVLRALRYKYLIDAAKEDHVPKLPAMALVTGVRNMMVDLFPARLGELIYVAILNRGFGTNLGACFSSLGIAVVFDFIALGLFVLLALGWFAGSGLNIEWLVGTLLALCLLIGIAYLALCNLLPLVAEKMKQRNNTNSHGWVVKLARFVSELNVAVSTTRQSAMLGRILLLSMLIRGSKYAGLYVLFNAVTEISLPDIASIPAPTKLSAIVGAEIGASLPVPAFMSFGSYEAGGTLALALLGVAASDSLLAMLGVHIWSQVVDYSIGGFCAVALIFLVRRQKQTSQQSHSTSATARYGAIALIMLLAGTATQLRQYRVNSKMGALSAPPIGESLRPQQVDLVNSNQQALAAQQLTGIAVWSSNRFGNHDILGMSLDDGEIFSVTSHPHTETWPRISTNGESLVFARALEPWVSQRNAVAWQVILMDLTTGDEKIIANNASYPFWIDPTRIGFLDHGHSVSVYDLNTDQIEQVFQSGANNSMPPGAGISSPDIHPTNNQLVFTGRQSHIGGQVGHWGTALTNLFEGQNQIKSVHEGCELNWSHNGKWLYQVGHGGKQKTMFYQIDPNTLESTPLLDLPGDYSHEYWPEDSNDGRYLIFGASQGDHEHDVADYEIFLWQIGQSADQAIRLTFHSGNDNWPDIYIKP